MLRDAQARACKVPGTSFTGVRSRNGSSSSFFQGGLNPFSTIVSALLVSGHLPERDVERFERDVYAAVAAVVVVVAAGSGSFISWHAIR